MNAEKDFKDLHIIKELDQDLISKMLLIAEEKGDKKYVISNNHTQEYQQEAAKLRDQLIDLIIDKDLPADSQHVLTLAKQMLEISRRCKRKNYKDKPAALTQNPTEQKPKEITVLK